MPRPTREVVAAVRKRPLSAAIGFSLGVPFVYGLYRAFLGLPSDFGLALLYNVLVSIAYPAIALLLAAILLRGGFTQRHVTGAMIIAATLLLLELAPSARAAVLLSGEYVRLATTVLFAEHGTDHLDGEGHPRMVWVHWRTRTFGWSPPEMTFLVYDDSDELALPARERSKPWRQRALDTFMEARAAHPSSEFIYDGEVLSVPFQARRLLGHYYIVDLSLW